MYFVEKVKKVSSTDLDNTVQEAKIEFDQKISNNSLTFC